MVLLLPLAESIATWISYLLEYLLCTWLVAMDRVIRTIFLLGWLQAGHYHRFTSWLFAAAKAHGAMRMEVCVCLTR